VAARHNNTLEGTMNPYQELERRASAATSLQDAAEVLEILLSGGFSVWTDGSLYNIKQLVARVKVCESKYSQENIPHRIFTSLAAILMQHFQSPIASICPGRLVVAKRRLLNGGMPEANPLLSVRGTSQDHQIVQ
jgi:hypothetical protein